MSSFRAIQKTGKIISVVGNLLEVSAITVEIGGMAEIDGCLCEVIGARASSIINGFGSFAQGSVRELTCYIFESSSFVTCW